ALPLRVHRAADLREHPLGIRLGARGYRRGLPGGGLELRLGAREHGRAFRLAPLDSLQMLRLLAVALLQAPQERLELAPLRGAIALRALDEMRRQPQPRPNAQRGALPGPIQAQTEAGPQALAIERPAGAR